MLCRLDRARPWNLPGHVCHTCHLRMLALRKQQLRHESTATPSQPHESIDSGHEPVHQITDASGDSWLSNFNTLPSTSQTSDREAGEENAPSRSRTKHRTSRNKDQETKGLPSSGLGGSVVQNYNGAEGLKIVRMDGKPMLQKGRMSQRTALGPGRRKMILQRPRVGDTVKKRAGNPLRRSGSTHEEGDPAVREAFHSVVGELKKDFAAEPDGPSPSSNQNIAPPLSPKGLIRRPLLNPTHRTRVDLRETKRQAYADGLADRPRRKAATAPATGGATINDVDLLKGLRATETRPPSPAKKLGLWERSRSYLFGHIHQADGQAQDPTALSQSKSNEATSKAAMSRETAFGVNKDKSTPPGDFAPPSLVTVGSPAFGETGPSSMAISALAKLHSSGWNLNLVSEENRTTAAKAKETKVKKKPATSKPSTKDKATTLKRRERMKREGTTTSAASKIRAVKSGPSEGEAKAKRSKRHSKARPEEADASPTETPAQPRYETTIKPKALHVTPLDIPQPPVPGLEHGLDRVLFNSGVYQLQDPHSRVYNFDPYLQKVMPVAEFDFNALKEYKTSSQDTSLASLAQEYNKRYIGSTSSMTGVLRQFHYLLSAFRPLNLDMLSRGFPDKLDTFTLMSRAPDAIFLRWKDGCYAIDADKEHDTPNVLMMLGKSMEKFLTLSPSEFERYRKSDPRSVSEQERNAPEAFQYTTLGDFLMRSQLDSHDPRLPGTGMFDLKTRAVVTVRHSTEDFERMTGYEIHTLQGRFESYEREYYDMMRATMLKYMLQARMGRMEGIFVAYHNVARVFGFQYVSMQEMDRILHGQVNRALGDQEFKASLEMLNRVFDLATAKYPGRSIRFHFETKQEKLSSSEAPAMYVFGEPMAEDDIDRIQDAPKARAAEFERTMMGIEERPGSETVTGNEVAQSAASGETSGQASSESNTGNDGAQTLPSADPVDAATSSSSTSPPASAASTDEQSLAPLFAALIMSRSTVNGREVPRPTSLTDLDDWKVEYVIQEFPTDKNIWARYEDMKSKRRDTFAKAQAEELGAAGDEDRKNGGEVKETKKARDSRSYATFLESMSDKGRAFREKVDLNEAGKSAVVFGQPAVNVDAPDEQVEDVEDYMGWLYWKGGS